MKDKYVYPFAELNVSDANLIRKELEACTCAMAEIDSITDPIEQLRRFVMFRLQCKHTHQEDFGHITCREAEIRNLIPGRTDKQIAQILHCSPNTVIMHMARLREKAGVHTRTALIQPSSHT